MRVDNAEVFDIIVSQVQDISLVILDVGCEDGCSAESDEDQERQDCLDHSGR